MEKKSKVVRKNNDKFLSLKAQFENSGLTQKAFCQKHQIAYSTFQYWLRKCKAEAPQHSSFVEVSMSEVKNSFAQLEIILPTGAKIICDAHSDISLIRSLIL